MAAACSNVPLQRGNYRFSTIRDPKLLINQPKHRHVHIFPHGSPLLDSAGVRRKSVQSRLYKYNDQINQNKFVHWFFLGYVSLEIRRKKKNKQTYASLNTTQHNSECNSESLPVEEQHWWDHILGSGAGPQILPFSLSLSQSVGLWFSTSGSRWCHSAILSPPLSLSSALFPSLSLSTDNYHLTEENFYFGGFFVRIDTNAVVLYSVQSNFQ